MELAVGLTVVTIASVVEGFGEVTAFPVLLRRLAQRRGLSVVVTEPHRIGRPDMLIPARILAATRVQLARCRGHGGVLVLLDADDDCPMELHAIMQPALEGLGLVQVVAAKREYEAWFLAGFSSLSMHPLISPGSMTPADPERPRDAKGVFNTLLNGKYRETVHQAKFSAQLDLDEAESRSRSFRRLVRAVDVILGVHPA